MSHPTHRRRFWRACAFTLRSPVRPSSLPAAALADGQLDTTFNGTGAHVGTAAENTIFNNVENRLPMVVQGDGKIVVGGSRGGFMTLVRYNANGSIDSGSAAAASRPRSSQERPTAGPARAARSR